MNLCAATLVFAMAVTQQLPESVQPEPLKLNDCVVSLIQDVDVPSSEPGILTKLHVKEGEPVSLDTLLASIDDREAKLRKGAAEKELHKAEETASNKVNELYAVASAKVAKAELTESIEINRRSPGTISNTEIRRQELQAEKGELQIQVSQHETVLAKIDRDVKQLQLDSVNDELERRQVKSRMVGIVEKLLRHEGEWVQPGDPIMRVVRMDRLKVEGFVNADEFRPEDVYRRRVTVTIHVSGLSVEQSTFTGYINNVSPLVEASGEFRVWAEIDNKQIGRFWVMRPGLDATMKIDTLSPAVPEEPAEAVISSVSAR